MDADEYIIDLQETFPDVWEPSVEQQFLDDVKSAISGCAKSDPFAASFAALEAAEREFAEKGADDSRCCRDRESFAKTCPSEDADFWLKELSESDDDERIAAIHGEMLRHWRISLERARALWREQVASERIARLYAEYVKRLKCIRKLSAEFVTFGASGFGWGLGAVELIKHDAATLLSWLHKIEGSQELKRLCDLIGRLMAAEKRKEREEIVTTVEYEVPKIDTSVKEEIAGITLGRSIEDAVPSELAACGDSELETLFDLKFIEGRLMCFEKSGILFEKRTKDEAQTVERETADGRGPMIICIDTSWSMSGDPEVVAKAVSLALVMRARQEKRKCYLIKFSTGIEAQNVGDGASLDAIIGFLSSSFNGGTDADLALKAGIKVMEQNDYRKADLLVVSDFCFGGQHEKITRRIRKQKKSGSRFYAVIVDEGFAGRNEKPPSDFDGVWRFSPGDCSLTALKEPANFLTNKSKGEEK